MLRVSRESAVLSALSLFLLVGCGGPSVKTHPVTGKVEIKDGDAAILTGSGVEFMHESDELLRPSGNIDANGNFTVKTLHQGEILPGAPEGKYKVRIILADPNDDGVPKRKGNPIHPRYFEYATSGLTVSVPSGDYTVTLSKK
jgi:hypothetical protein